MGNKFMKRALSLDIQGRYHSATRLWQDLGRAMGVEVRNADALYDLITDFHLFADPIRVTWQLPHQPLTKPERQLLEVLADAAELRGDLTLSFVNPPRWLYWPRSPM